MLITKARLRNIITNFLKEEFEQLNSSNIKLTRVGGIKTFKEKDRVYFDKIKLDGLDGIFQNLFDLDVDLVNSGQKVEYTLTNPDPNGIFNKLNLVVYNVDTYDSENERDVKSNKSIDWFDNHIKKMLKENFYPGLNKLINYLNTDHVIATHKKNKNTDIFTDVKEMFNNLSGISFFNYDATWSPDEEGYIEPLEPESHSSLTRQIVTGKFNAHFSHEFNVIAFGDGASDPDVVFHEFGHALDHHLEYEQNSILDLKNQKENTDCKIISLSDHIKNNVGGVIPDDQIISGEAVKYCMEDVQEYLQHIGSSGLREEDFNFNLSPDQIFIEYFSGEDFAVDWYNTKNVLATSNSNFIEWKNYFAPGFSGMHFSSNLSPIEFAEKMISDSEYFYEAGDHSAHLTIAIRTLKERLLANNLELSEDNVKSFLKLDLPSSFYKGQEIARVWFGLSKDSDEHVNQNANAIVNCWFDKFVKAGTKNDNSTALA